MISCTIGVFAYNEEENIVPALHAVLAQRTTHCVIAEIIVIASGCTDRTVERAQAVARQHPIIRVDAEQLRSGKAAAINRLLSLAQGEIVVLVGADTLPDPAAIEHLASPFADATVGMTGARVVPLNDPRSFMGFTVQILWHIHHRMALRWPKLGELVAFRNIVAALPINTATDEVALEAHITAQGYQLVYTPEAIVYNYGPEHIGDFLSQRRRIFAGHLHIAASCNYVAASLSLRSLTLLAIDALSRYPTLLPRLVSAALLEGWGRALGTLDALTGKRHHIWRSVRSTKKIPRQGRDLRIIVLYCRHKSVRGRALLRRITQFPAECGTLLWWDARQSQVVFLLPDGVMSAAALEQQVRTLAAELTDDHAAVLSYRVVEFPMWVEERVAHELIGSPLCMDVCY